MAEVSRSTTLPDLLVLAAREARDTSRDLEAARSKQWITPPRVVDRLSTAIVTSGVRDPVASVALDERRLALRDAVRVAELRLDVMSTLLRRLIHASLDEPDAQWQAAVPARQAELRLALVRLRGARRALARAMRPYDE